MNAKFGSLVGFYVRCLVFSFLKWHINFSIVNGALSLNNRESDIQFGEKKMVLLYLNT